MATLGAQIGAQGDLVRKLKEDKADKATIAAAVKTLQDLKAKLEAEQKAASAEKDEKKKFRAGFEDLLLRKFFYVPAFEIYGGVGGLYDFGPPGCAIKANMMDFWRQHFVLTENMLEVSCSALTPEIVLKTSGHVDKFTDFMVKDVVTGDCYRADKLLEDHVDHLIETTSPSKEYRAELLAARTGAGAFPAAELGACLKKYGCKAPGTGNELSDPYPFNLMFQTQIGPTGKFLGYMRPETAQGIFVNFRRLLEFNGGRMPFAAAQIGLAFRNEIAPRSGLLRVREFPMAEIEHFVDPKDKSHPKFKSVSKYVLNLLSRAAQTGEDIMEPMEVGKAVATGVINNETLGYFLVRTHAFLIACGVKPEKVRFRQHKSNEMAHYAADCWDAEILTTYGWIECVGHADRAAFDLTVHSERSKTDLTAQHVYDPPIMEEQVVCKLNHAVIGKTFKQQAKPLTNYLNNLEKKEALHLQTQLKKGKADVKLPSGESFSLTPDMLSIAVEECKVSVKKYTPGVIEPSFGIGRILYSILEHSYCIRGESGMLALKPLIAPVKCGLLPIGSTPEFFEIVGELEREFVELNLSTKVDPSGASIGRKYARSDEIGVPFAITVDFESMTDRQVTIRDRDSTHQVRVKIGQAPGIVADLCHNRVTWDEVYGKYPKFTVTSKD